MSVIAAAARAIRTLSIKIGSADYVKHVAAVLITNDSKAVVFKGGAPDAILTDVSAGTYMLEIDVVHDYQSATSLYNYLLANAGAQATFVYKPDDAGTFQATVTATIIPPTIGGNVDQFGRERLKMPCTKPTLVQPGA